MAFFDDELSVPDAGLDAEAAGLSDEDFEDALARAVHGEVVTDAGTSPEMLEALLRLAAVRTMTERRAALRAARLLREREHPTEYRDPDFAP